MFSRLRLRLPLRWLIYFLIAVALVYLAWGSWLMFPLACFGISLFICWTALVL